MAALKKKRPQNLAKGRPPTLQKPKSISRMATRSLINKHHLLEKRRQQAIAKGDTAEAALIASELSALGGLETYQLASLQGQRRDRGGDSSKVLMEWIKELLPSFKTLPSGRARMLEVGALSTSNECSKSGCFDIERIDLSSQGKGIRKQDFMERPLPVNESDRFDIISLSLVLNFVPTPQGRGEMLLRTLEFLHSPARYSTSLAEEVFPSIFLVLPAPCVSNSRYMDEARLEAIMSAIGFARTRSKMTNKLAYGLWRRTETSTQGSASFTKKEIRSGPSRNNFAVTLDRGRG